MLGKTWYEKRQASSPSDIHTTDLTELRFISPENILSRIKKNEEIRFIDIRSRTSFEALHILDSEWLGLAEISAYSAPTGQLVIIVYDEENTNDQFREIQNRFAARKMTFVFLEGGIRNWVARGGAVITTSNPTSSADQSKVTTITPEKAVTLIPTLVRNIIIDVRSDREFALGHIPGAINLPLSRLERERETIPSVGSIFVYGTNEQDTFQAGTMLFDMGFFGLRIITGGFESWKATGLPIEKSP